MYNQKLLKGISRQLIASGNTVAVAESVTSGHVQAALSAAENAGAFFEGGITVYNAKQKVHHLGVDAVEALKNNSVSQQIATQMALRCARNFMTSIGLGITGYASAMPFHADMELYACYAIVMHEEVLDAGVIKCGKKEEPFTVQVYYAEKVLEKLLKKLNNICPK